MEKEVHEINQKQAIAEKRIRKIEAHEIKKEEAKKKLAKEEEAFLKKSNTRTRYGIYFTCLLLGIFIAVPMLRKDPVHFWFCVIVILGSAGKVLVDQNNKNR